MRRRSRAQNFAGLSRKRRRIRRNRVARPNKLRSLHLGVFAQALDEAEKAVVDPTEKTKQRAAAAAERMRFELRKAEWAVSMRHGSPASYSSHCALGCTTD